MACTFPTQGMCAVDAVGSYATTMTVPTWVNTGHQAASGQSVEDFLTGGVEQLVAAAPPYPLDPTNARVKPMIVWSMLGTNNCGTDPDVATGLAAYPDLLVEGFTARPDLYLWVVSNIPPRADGAGNIARTTTFNAAIPGIVTDAQNLGYPVEFFDFFSLIDPATDLFPDGVHLNDAGRVAGGQGMYRGMRRFLGLDGSDLKRRVGRVPWMWVGDSNMVGFASGATIYPGGIREVCASYYWVNQPAPL